MKKLFILMLMVFSTAACQEFAKEAGETTKKAAVVVGDTVNSAAKAVEDAIDRK